MTPHKWAKEIKAWADGEEIEQRSLLHPELGWQPYIDKMNWFQDFEYRIKPQPKDEKPKYLYAYKFNSDIRLWSEKTESPNYIGKIKLETDDHGN